MPQLSEGLRGEIAMQLLQTSLDVFAAAHPQQPAYETELAAIQADFALQFQETDITYTRWMAEVLERMRTGEDIEQWYYVPRQSYLDELKVDFIIRCMFDDESLVVPMQVTSTTEEARIRRKEIRRLYGLDYDGFIPVVALRAAHGGIVPYETAREKIVSAMTDFEKAIT